MSLHPQVRKQKLKLMAQKLRHQSVIAESRDALRAVNEQLKQLKGTTKPQQP